MRPIGKNILVKPTLQEEKTASGLILAPTKQEKPRTGEILALGAKVEAKLDIGEVVIFNEHSPKIVEHEGKTLLIINEVDILAVI